MTTIFLCIGVVALCWGGYPLLVRAAGLTGSTGSLVLATVALLPIGVMVLFNGPGIPAVNAMVLLAIAGAMMGTGLLAFNFVATSSLIEISTVVPVINTTMLIVTTIGGIWFFSESITPQKIFGILLLLTGIILLRPNG